MKILLAAIEPELADAWERFCGHLSDVSVHHGPILDVSCDAVVSPTDGNGSMNRGISLHIRSRFGLQVEEQLKAHIRLRHNGELPVGSAEIVSTNNPNIPYLIAAPLSRSPMILRGSPNPYLAVRAALLLVKQGRFLSGPLEGQLVSAVVSSVVFPGLGTGGSQVAPYACAQQVRAAIEEVLLDCPLSPNPWEKS